VVFPRSTLRANDEHRQFGRSVGEAFIHALEAGHQLNRAQGRLRELTGKKDAGFDRWLAEHLDGSRTTAYEYMRLYRQRGEISSRLGSVALENVELTIADARRVLELPPKQSGRAPTGAFEAERKKRERAEKAKQKAQDDKKKAQVKKLGEALDIDPRELLNLD
jgi:hypothetical protein